VTSKASRPSPEAGEGRSTRAATHIGRIRIEEKQIELRIQKRIEFGRTTAILLNMKTNTTHQLRDGARCKVIGGTHAGKTGTVHDIKTGKTGHVSITVRQTDGVRFKILAKNVVMLPGTT